MHIRKQIVTLPLTYIHTSLLILCILLLRFSCFSFCVTPICNVFYRKSNIQFCMKIIHLCQFFIVNLWQNYIFYKFGDITCYINGKLANECCIYINLGQFALIDCRILPMPIQIRGHDSREIGAFKLCIVIPK